MRISFSDFGGAPVVLVFAREWTLGTESIDHLNVIRDGLRQVGAAMVVLSGTGIWCVRPDGDERFEAYDDEVEAEILRLATVYGMDRTRTDSPAPSVLVLDSHEKVRFAHTTTRDVRSTLAHGLSFTQRPAATPAAVDARKRDVARLIGALSGAFFGPIAEREAPAADAAE